MSLESGLDGSYQQEAFRAWLETEKACGAGGLRDAKKTNKDITINNFIIKVFNYYYKNEQIK